MVLGYVLHCSGNTFILPNLGLNTFGWQTFCVPFCIFAINMYENQGNHFSLNSILDIGLSVGLSWGTHLGSEMMWNWSILIIVLRIEKLGTLFRSILLTQKFVLEGFFNCVIKILSF